MAADERMQDAVRDLRYAVLAAAVEAGLVVYAYRRLDALTVINSDAPPSAWPYPVARMSDQLATGLGSWS